MAVRVNRFDKKGVEMTLEELRRLCAFENEIGSASQKVTDLELMLQLIRVLPSCRIQHDNGTETTDYEALQKKWGKRSGGGAEQAEKSAGIYFITICNIKYN